ncbi:VOC family protein [Isoptericola aurantiacus]|uniref:VOC family protein n=1 Tax=Isoptericola aurantiacus TaxID=3377839 RepID=UPI00383A0E56
MDPRVSLVTLVVADLEAARRFYVAGLGWEPLVDVPGEVLMFRTGERLVLSLWDERAAVEEIGPVVRGGTPPMTLAHNLGSRRAVDRVLDDAARAGAEVRSATARDWGGYSGYFTDPNGFLWEVAHAPGELSELLVPPGDEPA